MQGRLTSFFLIVTDPNPQIAGCWTQSEAVPCPDLLRRASRQALWIRLFLLLRILPLMNPRHGRKFPVSLQCEERLLWSGFPREHQDPRHQAMLCLRCSNPPCRPYLKAWLRRCIGKLHNYLDLCECVASDTQGYTICVPLQLQMNWTTKLGPWPSFGTVSIQYISGPLSQARQRRETTAISQRHNRNRICEKLRVSFVLRIFANFCVFWKAVGRAATNWVRILRLPA